MLYLVLLYICTFVNNILKVASAESYSFMHRYLNTIQIGFNDLVHD
jgi:hypothetical protein